MEINGLSKSARQKVKKRAKKEARKALRPKTFYQGNGAAFAFPVRNLRAAFRLAVTEQYPEQLGVTVWTSVKGNRPQVIEVQVLRQIIQHLDDNPTVYKDEIRIKITPTSVRIGGGDHSTTIHLQCK